MLNALVILSRFIQFCVTLSKQSCLQLDTKMSQNTSFSSTATKRPPSAENQFLLKESVPRNGSTPRGTRKSKTCLLKCNINACRTEEFWIQ